VNGANYATGTEFSVSGGPATPGIEMKMKKFGQYFSEEAIIRELCKARIKLASKRHDNLFLHNIIPAYEGAEAVTPNNWGSIPLDIFPPRWQWHSFRPKLRRSKASADLDLQTLFRAIRILQRKSPGAPWVIKLNNVVDRIQQRVLGRGAFAFSKPEIVFIKKSPAGDDYRAITILQLEDKVIDSLVARYLRESLDGALLPSCMAFRCCRPAPTTHSALEIILQRRDEWGQHGIYVAECDIKAFFDSVPHDVARKSLHLLIRDAKQNNPQLMIAPRAIAIFEAYLDVYAFEGSVLGGREYKEMIARHPEAQVKWPREQLRALHGTGPLPRIGVPQGAALSCLVANAVLHAADKALDGLAAAGKEFSYQRYCDDMILLAPHKAACKLGIL
jgi:hypothetical protein